MFDLLRRSRAIAPVGGHALLAPLSPAAGQQAARRDGQRDFDFAIGTGQTRLSRLVKPPTSRGGTG